MKNDWQTALYATPLWLCLTFLLTLGGIAVLSYGLSFTTFGRKWGRLTRLSLAPTQRIKLLGLMLLLLILVLLEVRISVLNTFFYNGLYSALQNKQAEAFWFFAGINFLLVMVKITHAIIHSFFTQVFEIRCLETLNGEMLDRWLWQKNYYLIQFDRALPDNLDQRIEQDAQAFISGTVSALQGLINALVSAVEFTLVLWGLSGILVIFGVDVPKGVVFFIYLFILVATCFSVWIGRPLVKLNFNKERFAGDYRYSLIRVRENAESIAFYSGEAKERAHLRQKFQAIIHNRWDIVRRTLGLDGFNTGVTQVAMILPLMLQAPRFFAGQITLGGMHQTVQSFNRLMRALSFFRLFYEEFTLYQARVNRLHSFFTTLERLENTAIFQPIPCDSGFHLRDFGVKDQQGKMLLQNINLDLVAGDSLLIQGSSGTGKTTLLKALAGIYPFETFGTAKRPCAIAPLFLPQRPYMPQGTLREAICYPNITASDETILQAMATCCLAKYQHALDITQDWQATLSPGELQRVAFVRILLCRPALIFLDETTSALDEPTEEQLYRTIQTALPESIIISVGHRCTLKAFHNKTLTLGTACAW